MRVLSFCLLLLSALLLPSEVFSQSCENITNVSIGYDGDCRIEVRIGVKPFNRCGAPLPGNIEARIFVNGGSESGGSLLALKRTSCEWRENWGGEWITTYTFSDLPFNTELFAEAWVNPGNSQPSSFCMGPATISYEPQGDRDGDGVANCVDECPGDPDKITPGKCGCGFPDDEHFGDTTLSY